VKRHGRNKSSEQSIVIYGSISNDQLEFVDQEETAYGIIKKRDSMYTRESTAIQICVPNKLEKLRLNDYEGSSRYFTEFEKLINEWKSVGAIVTHREKLKYMLRTLPDSLSHVGDLIDALKGADRTCEFLKNKIILWEAKDKENNCQIHTKKDALKSERKEAEKIYFGCGNSGHIKANCRNTWSREGFRRKNATGEAYGQGGAHQSYQQRGGRSRGILASQRLATARRREQTPRHQR